MTGDVGIVASPGGHVDEALEFADRFADRGERIWITAPTHQTTALLADERVLWVPAVKAREGLRAAQSLGRAFRIIHDSRLRLLVSTGAALSVPYLIAARALRVPVTFIESATRLSSPSLTGRIMQYVPGVQLYHQGSDWRGRSWQKIESVFDRYASEPGGPVQVQRALVTVGSERFPFSRAIAIARDSLPDAEIAWQTGTTPTAGAGLQGQVRPWWPSDELAARAAASDLLITHAGVGSILVALRAGLCPVVIPRTASLGEHVDEHQTELAVMLQERGLAAVVLPGEGIDDQIGFAISRRIIRRS